MASLYSCERCEHFIALYSGFTGTCEITGQHIFEPDKESCRRHQLKGSFSQKHDVVTPATLKLFTTAHLHLRNACKTLNKIDTNPLSNANGAYIERLRNTIDRLRGELTIFLASIDVKTPDYKEEWTNE